MNTGMDTAESMDRIMTVLAEGGVQVAHRVAIAASIMNAVDQAHCVDFRERFGTFVADVLTGETTPPQG